MSLRRFDKQHGGYLGRKILGKLDVKYGCRFLFYKYFYLLKGGMRYHAYHLSCHGGLLHVNQMTMLTVTQVDRSIVLSSITKKDLVP